MHRPDSGQRNPCAYARRYAAGRFVVAADANPELHSDVMRALAAAMTIDVSIDRLRLREELERSGISRQQAWRIALSAFVVDNQVVLVERDSPMRS